MALRGALRTARALEQGPELDHDQTWKRPWSGITASRCFWRSICRRQREVLPISDRVPDFLVLSVAVARPECSVTLIESHQRKAVFLKEASRNVPNVRVLGEAGGRKSGAFRLGRFPGRQLRGFRHSRSRFGIARRAADRSGGAADSGALSGSPVPLAVGRAAVSRLGHVFHVKQKQMFHVKQERAGTATRKQKQRSLFHIRTTSSVLVLPLEPSIRSRQPKRRRRQNHNRHQSGRRTGRQRP